ncbi:MAG: hypothetical protein SF052_01545 [Bacteroidia bacterium]|nr:hypothetical protein [Bacteroidia bacterium]
MKKHLLILLQIFAVSCSAPTNRNIITTDIYNFWSAYDQIVSTQDSALQYKYLDSLYFQKGTAGLNAIREARNYTPQDYIDAINNYPRFWSSVRENTLKTDKFVTQLGQGVEKLRAIYPSLKPAKIYFTIGALRTSGTTMDSLLLIGSEIAMTDANTVSDELPEDIRAARRTYFDSNPIDNLVFLNVHEYVHTQQKPIVHNLLSLVIYEGVAEFVAAKAMGIPSPTPAIEYGKHNDKVSQKFEAEMFLGYNLYQWLWGDEPNGFGVRDLGYYIGYQLCEIYYEKAADKKEAIKKLIELDYTDEKEIEDFVNETGFFSSTLEAIYTEFDQKRPIVENLKPFNNHSSNVSPETKYLEIEFSEPLNGRNTGVDFGDLGETAFPKVVERFWSEDFRTWTLKVELEANKHYQILISNNFRNNDGIPLKPYLIDFETGQK